MGYKDTASFINSVVNLVFLTSLSKSFKSFFLILAICTTCRKKHSEELHRKSDWLYSEETEGDVLLQRYCREGSRLVVAL